MSELNFNYSIFSLSTMKTRRMQSKSKILLGSMPPNAPPPPLSHEKSWLRAEIAQVWISTKRTFSCSRAGLAVSAIFYHIYKYRFYELGRWQQTHMFQKHFVGLFQTISADKTKPTSVTVFLCDLHTSTTASSILASPMLNY